MKVLLIPEDFRNDEHLLTPIIQQLFAHIGYPRAKIITCTDPLLGGIGQALNYDRLKEIFERYPMVDQFILCVDRDGDVHRRNALDALEQRAGADGVNLIGVAAIEEIETWALAGLQLPDEWKWKDVRSELHPKERYFQPLAKERKVDLGPGRGRKALGREASRSIERILNLCNEELGPLVARLKQGFQN